MSQIALTRKTYAALLPALMQAVEKLGASVTHILQDGNVRYQHCRENGAPESKAALHERSTLACHQSKEALVVSRKLC